MQGFSREFRPAVSVVVALMTAAVLTFSSLAAPRAGEKLDEPVPADEASASAGVLSSTGSVKINGNVAESGATVLSGSTVSTGADGNASIQLGDLGRINLSPNTTVTIVVTNGRVEVTMTGGGSFAQSLPHGVVGVVKLQGERTHFVVARGQLNVRSGDSGQILNPGEDTVISDAREAMTMGEALFSIETGDNLRKAAATNGGYKTAGTAGAVTLVGVAAATALGVIAGGDKDRGTLPRPSTVVP
jgi:hypothetical protein